MYTKLEIMFFIAWIQNAFLEHGFLRFLFIVVSTFYIHLVNDALTFD